MVAAGGAVMVGSSWGSLRGLLYFPYSEPLVSLFRLIDLQLTPSN